jgi:hypothetical protein
MKQQTAVEWLMISIPRGLVAGFKDAFERAKEIEREQINKAYYDGYYREEWYDVRNYYNETYGKDHENTNHSS